MKNDVSVGTPLLLAFIYRVLPPRGNEVLYVEQDKQHFYSWFI